LWGETADASAEPKKKSGSHRIAKEEGKEVPEREKKRGGGAAALSTKGRGVRHFKGEGSGLTTKGGRRHVPLFYKGGGGAHRGRRPLHFHTREEV